MCAERENVVLGGASTTDTVELAQLVGDDERGGPYTGLQCHSCTLGPGQTLSVQQQVVRGGSYDERDGQRQHDLDERESLAAADVQHLIFVSSRAVRRPRTVR
jgi:hypothetical protein